MKVSYFHVAGEVPDTINGPEGPDAAVVIDVLRATTTIAWALHNGAEAVQTFADLDELRSEANAWPEAKRLLVGERGGSKLDGFDLGNSPVSVVPETVKGKRLFMSTTNGTRSLHRVREVACVLTVALPNREAVAKRLIQDQPEQVWMVGSGWEGTYSLEDSLAAGALAESLLAAGASVANDEMQAALSLWAQWKDSPEACLRIASHGQRLIRLGDHDADFQRCAGIDQLSVVAAPLKKKMRRAASP